MNISRIVMKVVAAAALAAAVGTASAATEVANITASITIQGICKFNNTAITLPFGTVNPSAVAGDLTATAAVTYRCTNGTAPSSIVQSATTGNLTSGANTIAFSLNDLSTTTPQAGQGFGAGVTPRSLGTLTATIDQTVAQNAVAGTYNNDTSPVTLTINY